MNDMTFDPDILEDLKKYDEDYRRAKQSDFLQTTTFQPVPDGKYQVVVENLEVLKSKTSGSPMLKWRLRIAGPAMADRVLWKNRVINGKSLTWIEKDFRLCGVNMDSLSEIPQLIPKLLNLRLEVTKKASANGYEDIYFDRNLTAGGQKAVDASLADLDEEMADLNDDLPF